MNLTAYYGWIAAGGLFCHCAAPVAARRAGLPWWKVSAVLLVSGVGAVGGGLLQSRLLLHGWAFLREPALLLQGPFGLRAAGALLGLMLVGGLTARWLCVPLLAVADVLAPVVLGGVGISRLGCLFNGCCFGTVCHGLPWCIEYPRGSYAYLEHVAAGVVRYGDAVSAPVHPLPVYYFVLGVGLALLLFAYDPARSYPGRRALLGLTGYWLGSATIESFRWSAERVTLAGVSLQSLQWIAVAAALASGMLMLVVEVSRVRAGRATALGGELRSGVPRER